MPAARSDTLVSRIEHAAEQGGAVTFVDGDRAEPVEWGRLHEDARGVAAGLQARGVGTGTHVGFLAPTSRALVTAVQAAWLCGATAVVLPLPMRLGSIEAFAEQTRARVRRAAVTLLVADPALLDLVVPRPDDPPILRLDELRGGPERWERPAADPDDLALLQHTSGSTADPKGVMLSHRCITANLDAITRAAALDRDRDVLVSWLPLYHDMGLVGTLTLPMTTGTDLVLAAPQDFMAAPRRWMEWMSDFGGTATAGPNFSYALAARALRRASGLDLSRWRLALNGSEPVDPAGVEAFCEAARPHGFSPGAVFPAFGMAEATLAVTFPELGRGLAVDTVDRQRLETDREAVPVGAESPKGLPMALLGRPLDSIDLRIVDPAGGQALGGREAGELQIRGASVTPGYHGDEAATAAAFDGDWLRTGDLAYVTGGELVVCGRLKDVLIVGGRNVFPEDVERAAATVGGVRAGNVIAFGVEGRRGGEALVVAAETRAEGAELGRIRSGVARAVRESVGVPAREVVLVAPGSLPKTSSGKLQRSLCRRWWGEAELDVVAPSGGAAGEARD